MHTLCLCAICEEKAEQARLDSVTAYFEQLIQLGVISGKSFMCIADEDRGFSDSDTDMMRFSFPCSTAVKDVFAYVTDRKAQNCDAVAVLEFGKAEKYSQLLGDMLADGCEVFCGGDGTCIDMEGHRTFSDMLKASLCAANADFLLAKGTALEVFRSFSGCSEPVEALLRTSIEKKQAGENLKKGAYGVGNLLKKPFMVCEISKYLLALSLAVSVICAVAFAVLSIKNMSVNYESAVVLSVSAVVSLSLFSVHLITRYVSDSALQSESAGEWYIKEKLTEREKG